MLKEKSVLGIWIERPSQGAKQFSLENFNEVWKELAASVLKKRFYIITASVMKRPQHTKAMKLLSVVYTFL
jgi:hypothetical protein